MTSRDMFRIAGLALLLPALGLGLDLSKAPKVSNKQPAASDVNVVNTPNVIVANSPSVTVGNPASAPVPVVLVNGDELFLTREPFQFSGTLVNQTGESAGTYFYVPDDKRLVIEYVSMSAHLQPSQEVWEFAVETRLTGQIGVNHAVPVFKQATSTAAFYSAGQQVRLYGDPGTTVFLKIYVTNASPGNYYLFQPSVSGYLVPIESRGLGPGL
jgi:hypothetical protein